MTSLYDVFVEGAITEIKDEGLKQVVTQWVGLNERERVITANLVKVGRLSEGLSGAVRGLMDSINEIHLDVDSSILMLTSYDSSKDGSTILESFRRVTSNMSDLMDSIDRGLATLDTGRYMVVDSQRLRDGDFSSELRSKVGEATEVVSGLANQAKRLGGEVGKLTSLVNGL